MLRVADLVEQFVERLRRESLACGQRPQHSTFTRSKRTPRISASDGSLIDPPRTSRRITSRIHSPRASPCDLANSVILPHSSFVSFTVTGNTRFRVQSLSERASPFPFKIAIVPSYFRGAPKCTENRYVFEIAVSAPWCTCTTLSGVECQNSPGAKDRAFHSSPYSLANAFHRRTTSGACQPRRNRLLIACQSS
jgi:hypothetical protein